MKPHVLNETSGGILPSSPHPERPQFLLTEPSQQISQEMTVSAGGCKQGISGRRWAGMEERAESQSVQPASHRPLSLPSAGPESPTWSHFPLQRKPRIQKMHLTQKPVHLVPKRHSRSAEAGTPPAMRTRGQEGECLRKRNKTSISSVLGRTACWVTLTRSNPHQTPAHLALREIGELFQNVCFPQLAARAAVVIRFL